LIFHKKIKEKKAEDKPKKTPPKTSVVQCSPSDTRETSIKKLKTKRKDNKKNLYKGLILDLNIKKNKMVITKIVRKE
jgi:hypothetical protein